MSYFDGPEPSTGIVPTPEMNAPTPPVETPAPPEFVDDLIKALDAVRNRRSDIFAERYRYSKRSSFGEKGYKSNVRQDLELDAEDAELSKRESALMAQVRKLAGLDDNSVVPLR